MTSREKLAEDRAAAMFGRVLASWAQDCLRLRASGLDRPSARASRGFSVLPGAAANAARVRGPELAEIMPVFRRPAARAA